MRKTRFLKKENCVMLYYTKFAYLCVILLFLQTTNLFAEDVILNSSKKIKEKTVYLVDETVNSLAQGEYTVKGQVTDQENSPLPGVTVAVKGTRNGAFTNSDGNYELKFTQENATLVFSFLGKKTIEIKYTGQSVINVVMQDDNNEIAQIVVVGYGTQRKERVGCSLSEVKQEEIETKSAGLTSVESMLGGNVKGLQISQGSSAPGSSSTMRIRGITSPFSGGNNQPLFVIDGVAFNTDEKVATSSFGARQNPLDAIPPSEIESITVLKDAGATAIYGSRGANGVVIVNTKRGELESSMRVNFNSSVSISNPIKKWDLLDAKEFRQLHKMIAQNTIEKYEELGLDPSLFPPLAVEMALGYAKFVIDPITGELRETYDDVMTTDLPLFGKSNTNWQNELYQPNAVTQKYSLSISGGTDKTNYSSSIYYNDQDGLIKHDNQKSCGARLTLDNEIKHWLSMGLSLNAGGNKNFAGRTKTEGEGPMSEVINARPDMPVRDVNGRFLRLAAPYAMEVFGGDLSIYEMRANPTASLENRNNTKSNYLFGNAYIDIKPFEDLTLRTSLDVSNFVNKSDYFTPTRALGSYQVGSLTNFNKRENSYSRSFSTTLGFSANYFKTINEHAFGALVGVSSYKLTSDYEMTAFKDTGDDDVLTNYESGKHYISSLAKGESVMNSLYSRIQYSYSSKYTITVNMRVDESSKFGPSNRRGFFPSVALNWNLANESFMQDLGFIDQFKIRASYGKTGLANIGEFRYLRFWSSPDYPGTYMGNGIIEPEDTYPNKDIKWETTKELNIGIDFGFLHNRIYGSVDYYDKQSSDVIMPTPVFAESGAAIMYANRAELSNKGMEFELGGYIARDEDLQISMSVNLAYNRNILKSIKNNAINEWDANNFIEGQPVGVISGLKIDHIIKTQQEIDDLNAKSPTGFYQQELTGVGDYLYVDQNKDGVIDDKDRVVLGSQEPKFFGGLNAMAEYKGFGLTIGFQYSFGSEKLWQNAAAMYLAPNLYTNMGHDALYNTWTKTNTDAQYPRLTYRYRGNAEINRIPNEALVQDASYLRLKIVNLSYTLPQNAVKKIGLSALTFYIAGTNLHTFTNYKGLDPEAIGKPIEEDKGILDGASGRDAYPMARTYTLGMRLSF